MSAPNTNTETELQRHRPAMSAIAGAIGIGLLMFVLWFGWVFLSGDAPEGANVLIDGRTGEAVSAN